MGVAGVEVVDEAFFVYRNSIIGSGKQFISGLMIDPSYKPIVQTAKNRNRAARRRRNRINHKNRKRQANNAA